MSEGGLGGKSDEWYYAYWKWNMIKRTLDFTNLIAQVFRQSSLDLFIFLL